MTNREDDLITSYGSFGEAKVTRTRRDWRAWQRSLEANGWVHSFDPDHWDTAASDAEVADSPYWKEMHVPGFWQDVERLVCVKDG